MDDLADGRFTTFDIVLVKQTTDLTSILDVLNYSWIF